MKNFHNFKRAVILTETQKELKGDSPVIFCNDENGKCWEECKDEFHPDTMKVKYMEDDGVIVSAAKEAWQIWPDGGSVAEVSMDYLPEGFIWPGFWRFIDGKVVQVKQDVVDACERQRGRKMEEVTKQINHLVAAEDDDDITPAEEILLAKLRTYRATLRRLPLDDAPNVAWPTLPELEEENDQG